MLVLLNKPFKMLSQFNPNPDYPEHRTLAELDLPKGLRAVGRLDYDSEGLLLLTDDAQLERRLLAPEEKHARKYMVQVDGSPSEACIAELRQGGLEIRVNKKVHRCAPMQVKVLSGAPEGMWERSPRVDEMAAQRSTWLELTLTEGKNRQIRRMTAKVGHPTLRLVRSSLLHYAVHSILPGHWKQLDEDLSVR